jgi:hypothetical protein
LSFPIVIPPAGAEIVTNLEECSCIKTARALGVKVPFNTNAEDIKPVSIPQIGGLVLLRYDKKFHVAVLEGFKGGFQVAEGGFIKGPCVVTRRIIDFNDSHIAGFNNMGRQ